MSCTHKILLVDDDDDSLYAMQHALAPLGHGVVCVRSGEQGLKAALQTRFSLIVLDVVLHGGMDGLQTMSYLKSLDQTRQIPILMLTGILRDVGRAHPGFANGVADYVTKPIEPWQLQAKARLLIRTHDEINDLRAKVAALEEERAELRHSLSETRSGPPRRDR